MYKLLAIDLDGTLLNTYGEISKENKEALKKAKQKGIEIVITSGRTSSSVEWIAKEIGAENYVIKGNGAFVVDLKSKEIIYNESIPTEKVLEIIKQCEENQIYYVLNTTRYFIAKKLNNNLLWYYYENSKKPENKTTPINIVENIERYIIENNINDVAKITISDENEIIFRRNNEETKTNTRSKCFRWFKIIKKDNANRYKSKRT